MSGFTRPSLYFERDLFSAPENNEKGNEVCKPVAKVPKCTSRVLLFTMATGLPVLVENKLSCVVTHANVSSRVSYDFFYSRRHASNKSVFKTSPDPPPKKKNKNKQTTKNTVTMSVTNRNYRVMRSACAH